MPKKETKRRPGGLARSTKSGRQGPADKAGAAKARPEKGAIAWMKRVMLTLQGAVQAKLVYDGAAKARLKGWLIRLASGSDLDLRSNIFRKGGRNRSYQDVVAEFSTVYAESLARSGVEQGLVDLIYKELEEGNREKIGPKSMYLGYFQDGPDKLKAVMSDKPIPAQLDRRAWKQATDRLRDEHPADCVRLSSIEDTMRVIRPEGQEHNPEAPGLDGSTNSGYPFFAPNWRPNPGLSHKKYELSLVMFNYIQSRAKALAAELYKGRQVNFVAMVGQRTVSRGLDPLSDPKTKRLILALDKAEAVLWKTLTPQIQALRKEFKCPGGVRSQVAWLDLPAIDVDMQLMLQTANKAGRIVLSGDVSAFDASVIPALWADVARAISPWFYKARKFFEALNLSDIYNVTVISPAGIVQPTASSIKSGSGGTNFVDCMYNLVTLYYGEAAGFYKLTNYSVQGDDFVADGDGVSPDSIAEAYKHTGLTVHPDKQTYTEGALSYLQRLHYLGYEGGMASAFRVLGSLLVYEKLAYKDTEWNPWMDAIIAISKLENLVFHPVYEDMVAYVAENDKYRLGSGLDPQQVIKKAGSKAADLLATTSRSTLNPVGLTKTARGFGDAATNGVLRGERLPPVGSHERWVRAYGELRISKSS